MDDFIDFCMYFLKNTLLFQKYTSNYNFSNYFSNKKDCQIAAFTILFTCFLSYILVIPVQLGTCSWILQQDYT